MSNVKTCVVASDNHSDDLVIVHHGSPDGPLEACGFHWTYFQRECFEAVRTARAASGTPSS